MNRILVVYYSRTGHTRTVAQAIAGACSADLAEIRESRSRLGLVAWFRSIFEVRRRACPPILPVGHDVSDYDLVVLGTPVWASCVSSPMRSFLAEQAARLPAVALFCTEGGSGGEAVLREMGALCRKAPVATMILRDAELIGDKLNAKLAGFTDRIRGEQSRAAA